MATRSLNAEEQRLWGAVMATVRPLRAMASPIARVPLATPDQHRPGRPPIDPAPPPRALVVAPVGSQRRSRPPVTFTPAAPAPANTLDGSWDRKLARGMVAPDASIDLHGHTLASAHGALDAGLARSIARGDRVLLLVTGKPPKSPGKGVASEGPHARGAIRAAVADWLAASRHADAIAAVRGAHPRHGGQGALYIVLRRTRTPA